jgi:hypothetical protein
MKPNDKPLGYWLKHLDGLIEAAFDRLLTDVGLQRRHWQTLQLLAVAPRTKAGIAAALAPFLGGATLRLDDVLVELGQRRWVLVEADTYTLTPEGVAAHARIGQRVLALRRQTVDGVSPDEYGATLGVLARIADNLMCAEQAVA